MHIKIKNTVRATLKYMQIMDGKSGHSPLLTARPKLKYNVQYDRVDLRNEHFKKADRSKSLSADLKEFSEVNSLILDGR